MATDKIAPMSEVSYPRLTSESILDRILDIIRQPAIERLQKTALESPLTSISVAKAESLLKQLKSKTTPSGWQYFHRTLRRQPRFNDIFIRLTGELIRLIRRLNTPLRKMQERVDMVSQNSLTLEHRVNDRLAALDEQKTYLELLQSKMEQAFEKQQQELADLRETMAGMQQHSPQPVPDFDRLYLHLEKTFRGDEELVRKRLAVYLPHLARLKNEREMLAILDLGCGRGEWLDLLREAKYEARGVDTNAEAARICRERGLRVVHSDLLRYLSAQNSQSVDVISAFHVIEHLRFDQRVRLLDESMRVLRKGGMIVFETPDVENLLVSSRSFYYDPTHRTPLPAPLFQVLLEARGFDSIETLKLNPAPEEWRMKSTEAPALAEMLNQRFYGAQDYAIIARKKP